MSVFLSRARKEEKTQQQMTACREDLILAERWQEDRAPRWALSRLQSHKTRE